MLTDPPRRSGIYGVGVVRIGSTHPWGTDLPDLGGGMLLRSTRRMMGRPDWACRYLRLGGLYYAAAAATYAYSSWAKSLRERDEIGVAM